ncbi:unnamed protein product [Arctogadus glacialis]
MEQQNYRTALTLPRGSCPSWADLSWAVPLIRPAFMFHPESRWGRELFMRGGGSLFCFKPGGVASQTQN